MRSLAQESLHHPQPGIVCLFCATSALKAHTQPLGWTALTVSCCKADWPLGLCVTLADNTEIISMNKAEVENSHLIFHAPRNFMQCEEKCTVYKRKSCYAQKNHSCATCELSKSKWWELLWVIQYFTSELHLSMQKCRCSQFPGITKAQIALSASQQASYPLSERLVETSTFSVML